MKKLVLPITIFLCSFSAYAVSYQESTELPSALRNKVTIAIEASCPKAFEIVETRTHLRIESIDQGIRDEVYTTEFSAKFNFDGVHPVGARIIVRSVIASISNPSIDPISISKIHSDPADLCK